MKKECHIFGCFIWCDFNIGKVIQLKNYNNPETPLGKHRLVRKILTLPAASCGAS